MKIIDNIAQKLYLGVSKIPGAGVGLYSGVDILNGIPVCEYKGEVFDVDEIQKNKDTSQSEQSKKLSAKYQYTMSLGFEAPTPLYSIGWSPAANRADRKLIDAQPSLTNEPIGLGGFVNDIRGWQERIKPEYESIKKQTEENIKTVEGLKANNQLEVEAGYNVTYWSHPTEVLIYLLAIRDIKAGEEIYVNYGDAYWQPFIRKIKKDQETQKKSEENEESKEKKEDG